MTKTKFYRLGGFEMASVWFSIVEARRPECFETADMSDKVLLPVTDRDLFIHLSIYLIIT